MRPALCAVLAFLVATTVALRMPRIEPPRPAAVVVTAPPPAAPTQPIDRMEAAIRARRWDAAAIMDRALPTEAAAPLAERMARLRDRLRRGMQRDASGVIESTLLAGGLAALGAADAQRANLTQIAPGRPYTLPAGRRDDLLLFSPRGLRPDGIEALLDELRLLRIEGLELNTGGREPGPPLPGLAGAQVRYLGGSAIDRVPTEVFAACGNLEALDLQGRQQGVGMVLSALAGRSALRILLLPASWPPDAAGMAALASLSGLEELQLSGRGLTAEAIAPLTGLTRLRRLRVEQDVPDQAFASIGRLIHLRRLSCSIAATADLAPLAGLPDLDDLSLAVAAPGLAANALSGLRLTRLRLQGAGVDDRCVVAVRNMPQLERLELASTQVSDAGVVEMAANAAVHALEINGNGGIAGACLPALLRSPGLTELRLASERIPETVVLACPDPGRLERFTWAGGTPSQALIDHLLAWPGVVQVSINGKIDKDVRQRLHDANERRASVPPDLPGPAIGF